MGETRKLAGDSGRVQQACRFRRGSDAGATPGALSDLIDPTIAVHHGRVVKRSGHADDCFVLGW